VILHPTRSAPAAATRQLNAPRECLKTERNTTDIILVIRQDTSPGETVARGGLYDDVGAHVQAAQNDLSSRPFGQLAVARAHGGAVMDSLGVLFGCHVKA
jgi:hypothetical protein